MSNEKPERVEVGQRYRTYANIDGEVVAISDGMATLKWTDGGNCSWETAWPCAGVLSTKNLRYLGPSPGKESPVMEARDWEKWLPPRILPSTPGQRFKTGQVFASSCLDGDFTVCRVLEKLSDHPWMHKIECLASRNSMHSVGATFECSATFYRMDHAVLVADVGCEPTPPEVLYAPRQPALPAPAVPTTWECIRCGGRHPAMEKLCPTRKPKYGRLIGETRAPDGTPLSALQSIPCVRSSEDLRPKPPWVPSCDIDCDIPDAFPVRR